MRQGKFIGWTIGSMLCAIVVLAGCSQYKTWGEEPAPAGRAPEVVQTVESIENTRQELVRSRLQVDEVLGAMDQLASTRVDLRPAYALYSGEVSETVIQGRSARERAQEMRDQWQQYITSWEREIDQITTPELRESVTKRRQTVRENYDNIRDAARAVDAAYEPFVRQLRDIQRALSLDLTPAGVAAAQPAFASARQAGDELKQRINEFIAQLDNVSAGLSSRPESLGTTTPETRQGTTSAGPPSQ